MWTVGQRARMRATQDATMGDTCVPLVWEEGRDPDGQETEGTYVPQAPTVCGYQPKGSREANTLQVTTQDQIRLPYDAGLVLSSNDRIRLTSVFGDDLATPQEFMVDGEPRVGPTAIVVPVVQVTT